MRRKDRARMKGAYWGELPTPVLSSYQAVRYRPNGACYSNSSEKVEVETVPLSLPQLEVGGMVVNVCPHSD